MLEAKDVTDETPNHTADRRVLPAVLRNLPWSKVGVNDLYGDGDRYLAAVPVRPHGMTVALAGGQPDWWYEITDITIEADEGHFAVTETGGDCWGWDITDADWLLPIYGDAAATASQPVGLTEKEREDLQYGVRDLFAIRDWVDHEKLLDEARGPGLEDWSNKLHRLESALRALLARTAPPATPEGE